MAWSSPAAVTRTYVRGKLAWDGENIVNAPGDGNYIPRGDFPLVRWTRTPMSLITSTSNGVFVIAVTPFTEDLAVDLASIDTHDRLLFRQGRRRASPFWA